MPRECDTETGFFCVIRLGETIQRIHWTEPGRSVIGRAEEVAIRLPDPLVSRKHAFLTLSADKASIVDMRSTNGTVVNGQRIDSEVTLDEGSEIVIGSFTLKVWFKLDDAIRQYFYLDESTCRDSVQTIMDHPTPSRLDVLTPAQRRVCEEFLYGMSEKEVATSLGLSIHTVHTHAKAIYKAFAISSRAELMSRPDNQR